MKIAALDWNRKNVEHLAKHRVSAAEVEEVVFEDAPFVTKGSWGRYYVYGQTSSGRYLFMVIALLGNHRARVITARDMIKREGQYYQARR